MLDAETVAIAAHPTIDVAKTFGRDGVEYKLVCDQWALLGYIDKVPANIRPALPSDRDCLVIEDRGGRLAVVLETGRRFDDIKPLAFATAESIRSLTAVYKIRSTNTRKEMQELADRLERLEKRHK